ncbi:hypothetical protein BDV96DRAFT_306784 [Lophiotrema nucula]|uniref:Uncharacterized protein n=1 Tax=Lophiotrema nucula TaxID=690887 RepID=A0A6A5YJM8_9PLEO|nr:hypothetical protein BDV96DRAFT_306784 [Lophiotrema nucula]
MPGDDDAERAADADTVDADGQLIGNRTFYVSSRHSVRPEFGQGIHGTLASVFRASECAASIANNLTFKALLEFGLCDREIGHLIFAKSGPKGLNLLRYAYDCGGRGMRMRDMFRQLPRVADWTIFSMAFCGKDDPTKETRPCITCGWHVCNECRVHVLYQKLLGPNWSFTWDDQYGLYGFVFLDPEPRIIWSPKTHEHSDSDWVRAGNDQTRNDADEAGID